MTSRQPESPFYTFGFIAVWVLLGVDLAAMFAGAGRQTLHDRAASTFVVRAHAVS